MELLRGFAAGGRINSTLPRPQIFVMAKGWMVYYPPEVAADFTGGGELTAGLFIIHRRTAAHTGSGTLSAAQVFTIAKAAANLTGVGDVSMEVSLTDADVDAFFTGDGTASATTAYHYKRAADATGSGALSSTYIPIARPVADFDGVGNLNPEGVTEVEFTPLNLSGNGTLSTTLATVQSLDAPFTGAGALEAAAMGQVNFASAGMNKSATQSLPTNSWTQITGWTARSDYPGTTITSNGIEVPAGVTVTIAGQLSWGAADTYSGNGMRMRVMAGGVELTSGATSGNSSVSAVAPVTWTNDTGSTRLVTVQGFTTSNFFSRNVVSAGANSHLTLTVITPLVLRASDNFDRPSGPLGPNWITTGGGTLDIVNGRLNGVGTPSVPLSYAYWHEPMPSDTQVVRAVLRWDGYNPQHSSAGLVVRAHPETHSGVEFAFTNSIMSLYYVDLSAPNGFTPATGTPQYVTTSKFPEGSIVELRAEGNLYTARVNGSIVLQGTVGNDKVPFSNRYVGAIIQDDSQVSGGGQPPGRLDDWEAYTQ